jgi:hypothetical protein
MKTVSNSGHDGERQQTGPPADTAPTLFNRLFVSHAGPSSIQ